MALASVWRIRSRSSTNMADGSIGRRSAEKAALLRFNFHWRSLHDTTNYWRRCEYIMAPSHEKIMKDLENKSVLIVDDDPGMLRAMTKVLANEGMYVTGVSDPTAVVTRLAEPGKRFDLVITDLRMPTFSGRCVLALASALSELPVIIITAFGGPDVEAQALQLGAFAFLEKPVAAAELIDVVKRALAASPIQGV